MSDAGEAAGPVTNKGDIQVDAADTASGNATLPPPTTEDAATAVDDVTPEVTRQEETTLAPSPDQRRDGTAKQKNHSHNSNKKFEKHDHRENIKSRFHEEESADHAAIRHQVEFYFSDSNLPIDNYMLELTGGNANIPVEIKKIHSFKRMKHFQPYSTVVEAIKGSNFLVVSEKDEITRKVPLDAKFTDDVVENKKLLHTEDMPRSVYVKDFGSENEDTHKTIEAFFEPYGPVRSLRLRREVDMTFKGSVFAEFDSVELQQKFLALDPKPQFNGKELVVMSKQQYVDEKHQGIIDGLVTPRSPRTPYTKGGHRHFNKGSSHGRGGRGGNNRGRGRRDGGGRGSHRDHRDRYRSRSRSRDRGHRKNDSYEGDKDNWNERRQHDRRSSKRHRGDGHNDRKRNRDDDDGHQERDEIDDRATAEGKRVRLDEAGGETGAGVEDTTTKNGNVDEQGGKE